LVEQSKVATRCYSVIFIIIISSITNTN